MDDQQLVAYMEQYARRDMMDGTGRIFLPDFLKWLPIEGVTAMQMLTSWRKQKPQTPINQPTENVIRIVFASRSLPPSMKLSSERNLREERL